MLLKAQFQKVFALKNKQQNYFSMPMKKYLGDCMFDLFSSRIRWVVSINEGIYQQINPQVLIRERRYESTEK